MFWDTAISGGFEFIQSKKINREFVPKIRSFSRKAENNLFIWYLFPNKMKEDMEKFFNEFGSMKILNIGMEKSSFFVYGNEETLKLEFCWEGETAVKNFKIGVLTFKLAEEENISDIPYPKSFLEACERLGERLTGVKEFGLFSSTKNWGISNNQIGNNIGNKTPVSPIYAARLLFMLGKLPSEIEGNPKIKKLISDCWFKPADGFVNNPFRYNSNVDIETLASLRFRINSGFFEKRKIKARRAGKRRGINRDNKIQSAINKDETELILALCREKESFYLEKRVNFPDGISEEEKKKVERDILTIENHFLTLFPEN